VLLKQYWFSVCKLLGQHFIVSPCLQVTSETSRPQDHMDASGERCSDGVVGNALIHHSTIAECDHSHASYVDTRLCVTHRLHPRGLELSMFAMRIWRCIDYLHLPSTSTCRWCTSIAAAHDVHHRRVPPHGTNREHEENCMGSEHPDYLNQIRIQSNTRIDSEDVGCACCFVEASHDQLIHNA
jgi:hypothetical protein